MSRSIQFSNRWTGLVNRQDKRATSVAGCRTVLHCASNTP